MNPDYGMDRDRMREMEAIFKDSASQIEDLASSVMSIAGKLEDGGLQGKAGDEFAHALRQDLMLSLNNLRDKMVELANDINRSIELDIQAEAESTQRYG